MSLRVKINKTHVLLGTMLILSLRPYYVQEYYQLNEVWKYSMAFFAGVSIFQVCIVYRIKDICLYWLYLFCVSYVIGTIFTDNGDYAGALSCCAQIILANNVGIITKHLGSHKLLESISRIISICIYLDSILGVFRFSSILGKAEVYTFWGYDNYAAYVLLPLIATKCAIDSFLYGKLIFEDYLCIILMISYKIYTASINAIAFFALFFLTLLFMRHYDIFKKRIKVWHIVLANIMLIVLIVKFEIYKLFEKTLVSMGKGTNFGYRADFWKRTVRILSKIPLFGYGKYRGSFYATLVGYNPVFYSTTTHSHNFFLDLWIQTGLIGMLLYYLYIYGNLKNVKLSKSSFPEKVILLGIVIYYLMGFIDAYPFVSSLYFMIGILGFTQYSNDLRPIRGYENTV